MLSADDFCKVFVGGFNAAHHLTGLRALKIEQGDGAAQDAAKAIYDTILEVPALHFMLRPGGKWLERALAVGMFALPMARAVKAELLERRRPVMKSPGVSAEGLKKQPVPHTPPAPGEPDDVARLNLTGGMQ